ncbi:MAG: CDP-alcohol phosphatidyltransferase family protein [Vicinamibacterales bacterium]|jgi:cardiolipin synthase|nr:CDP-alcohol phosphatidyltransferase family protein [Vicinamibacterales bacterium]HJN44821.1 CDP-alcohol phosphatidyltransferase family protein [Vicinamibacterales bacterium]|tara:strand:+ start:438 stop:995 length:558 start_codon:yes stop_codon:yes gene_type:complete
MSALTVANQLTLLRMLLIPALVILVLYGLNGWALVVFVVAGLTDALDGILARWWGQRTTLGALLDPMADKLLLISTFVVLTSPALDLPNRLPIWLTVLVISRDVIIVVTVAIVNLSIGRRTFQPTLLGKLATFVYILTAAVTMYFNWLGQPSVFVDTAIYAALGVTLASGLHYIAHATRVLSDVS